MLKHTLLLTLLVGSLMVLPVVHAELVSLEDEELGRVDGEGIGLVLEDFVFNAGTQVDNGSTFEIGGFTGWVEDASGGWSQKNATFSISQLYIAGEGSNRGTNVNDNPVNIGRLTNPYNIELVDGDTIGIEDTAVLEFAHMKKAVDVSNINWNYVTRADGSLRADSFSGFNNSIFSSRSSERADLGVQLDLEHDGVRTQSLQTHIQSLAVDGSRLRLWGDGSRLVGEMALNIYSPYAEFFACNQAGNNCGTAIALHDVAVEVELGFGNHQPVSFEVDSTGNFTFEVSSVMSLCDAGFVRAGGCNIDPDGGANHPLTDFYQNGPKGNIYVGEVTVGNKSFGSSTIANLQIQYLHVKSRDL